MAGQDRHLGMLARFTRRGATLAGLATLAGCPALTLVAPARAVDDAAVWAALRAGGGVAVIRHALAPGNGDPPGFRIGTCATQRNLDEGGRRQARALGERFRREGVAVQVVRSSRWCRAEETARLAFPDVELASDSMLDSFFGERELEPGQTGRVREVVSAWSGREGTLVLVTHQVNITALTGVFPDEGAVVVLRPESGTGFRVVGSVAS